MQRMKLGLFVTGFILISIGTILLLNFTAFNPTHRRYSSASPVINANSPQEIGISGERILAADLGLPRNDDPDQRQCICNSPSYVPGVAECRVCSAYSQSVANYRRPDFFSPQFIAESKNRQGLLYTHDDLVNQIGDYAIAARALNIPLWVYVRVDTQVDPEFKRIVRETGGNIIYYFTVPGYVDPIDRLGRYLLIAGLTSVAVGIVFQLSASRRSSPKPPRPTSSRSTPNPSPTNPTPPDDALRRAMRSVNATEDFTNQSVENLRRTIDKESARDEFSKKDDDIP
jgi:hypothetical protein